MNEDTWIIRPYSEGDEAGYIALMNAAFPRYKCDLKRWRWEFKNNPFGSIQAFSDSEGRIVGHLGLICVPIKIENHIVLGAQAVDGGVHPNFRRKGIFLELGTKCMRHAKNRGIVVSYGIPNELSYQGLKKSGWFLVSEIPVLIKIMSKKGFLVFVLARLSGFISTRRLDFTLASKFVRTIKNWLKVSVICSRKISSQADFEKHVVMSFDERFDKLWEEMSSQYRLLVVRNAKYLNWRYVKKPQSSYVILTVERNSKIEGYVVLFKESYSPLGLKRGYVVDIFASSQKAICCLLQYTLEHFVKENVDSVTCWVMKDQLLYNCLSQNGFIDDCLNSQKLICCIHVGDSEFERLYYKVEKEWFFTMGDSDVI